MYTLISWMINIWFILNIWNGIKISWILRKHNYKIVFNNLLASMFFQSLTQFPWSKKIPLIALLGAERTGTLCGFIIVEKETIKWQEILRIYMIPVKDINKLEKILPFIDYQVDIVETFHENSNKGLSELDEELHLEYLMMARQTLQDSNNQLKKMITFESNVLVISDHEVDLDVFKQKEAFDSMSKKVEALTNK